MKCISRKAERINKMHFYKKRDNKLYAHLKRENIINIIILQTLLTSKIYILEKVIINEISERIN